MRGGVGIHAAGDTEVRTGASKLTEAANTSHTSHTSHGYSSTTAERSMGLNRITRRNFFTQF